MSNCKIHENKNRLKIPTFYSIIFNFGNFFCKFYEKLYALALFILLAIKIVLCTLKKMRRKFQKVMHFKF